MLDKERALAVLRDAGLRRTPQRVAVIEVLAGNREHPDARTVWEAASAKAQGISLSTVYAVLDELRALGLVQEVPGEVLRVDPDVSPHAHFTCRICGHVFDVPTDAASGLRAAASRQGHSVEHVGISITGTCSGCRKKQGKFAKGTRKEKADGKVSL
ncbi:MAG: Fur family transcriptional regulator [Coriobacteriia bacterium]